MKGFRNCLVTGRAGFIASHLVDRLMGIGCFVRIVDDLGSGSVDNVKVWLDS